MTSAPVATASSEADVAEDGVASPLHDLDTLVVGDLVFEIAPPSDRKTIEIIVERDASLVLKAPRVATVDRAEQFVIDKRPWVYRKLADKDALTGPPIVKQFVDGEGFAYLGRSYRLSLTRSGDSSGVRLERGRFHLSASEVSRGVELMRRWYTEVGSRWLQRRIRPWASRLGDPEVTVEVRDLGYRWGSARPSTDAQRINMHWATLQLRPSLIDYILVHELAHLHETNHTPEFWSIVARLMPSYEQQIATLSTTGKTIWLGAVVACDGR